VIIHALGIIIFIGMDPVWANVSILCRKEWLMGIDIVIFLVQSALISCIGMVLAHLNALIL